MVNDNGSGLVARLRAAVEELSTQPNSRGLFELMAAKVCAQAADAHVATLAFRDPATGGIDYWAWSARDEGLALTPDCTRVLRSVVRRGEPVFYESVAEFPSGIREVAEAAGNRALVAVPSRIQGEVVGALGLSFSEEREITAAERDFAGVLADVCACTLTAVRLQQESAHDKALLQTILDHIPSGVVVRGPVGRIVLYNRRAEEILGTVPPELVDLCETECLRPDGTPFRFGDWPLVRTLSYGEVVKDEPFMVHSEGHYRAVRCSSVPVRDSTGTLVAGLAVFDEVHCEEPDGKKGPA